MTIDPEKLEEALEYYSELVFGDRLGVMREAARAHLATLPRYKEVEVERWAIFDQDGAYWTSFAAEDAAHEEVADQNGRLSVVRLTGTAKVKVTP